MRDEEIIERFEQRSETAITAAMLKYGAYCRTIAGRILPSREDCEECVNDTWGKAWDSIPPQHPGNLKMYLAAITRNLALNRRAKYAAEKRGGTELDVVFEELAECIADAGTPEDAVIGTELGIGINSFLKTCSARERDVFLRRYFFTEDTAAIAERYRMRQSNVLVILSRTRKKLKKYLKKEGYLE